MAAVEDKDLGYTAIITQLKALGGAEISVGVLRNAGKEKDGTDLVDVAVYNEYGTRHIPPRPFLRIATDEHGGEWQDLAEKCVGKIIDGALDELRCDIDITRHRIENGLKMPEAKEGEPL